MKATIIKFGLISAALMGITAIIGIVFKFHETLDYGTQEVYGYASILLSLILIFFAMKEYRDQHNGGRISYGQAVKIGLLISIFPSVLFMLYNYYFVLEMVPDFMDKYAVMSMQQQNPDMTAEQVAIELVKMKEEQPIMFNIHFQGALMFFTVFIIGAIESLIFAALIKKNTDDTGLSKA